MRYWHWPVGSGLGGLWTGGQEGIYMVKEPRCFLLGLVFPALCAVEGGQGPRIFRAFYLNNLPSVAKV